jgi:NADH dehydrogenase [ubiquinone] 1 alpha subcomplex assembly factor 1
MLSLRSTEDLTQFVTGCDGDLGVSHRLTRCWELQLTDSEQGGKSTINFDLGPEGKGRFFGSLSSELREGRKKDGVIERGGYAGLRSKVSPMTREVVEVN